MSLKGGYKIINLKGYEFNDSAKLNVKGIADEIKLAVKYGKRLVFSGVNFEGFDYNDFEVLNASSDNKSVQLVGGNHFSITIYTENFDSYLKDDVVIVQQ